MCCSELVSPGTSGTAVDLGRYDRLHQDGRGLISGWFNRAWEARDCSDDQSFEPFMFGWIAFNSWAACVTGEDTDRRWRDALSINPELAQRFQTFSADSGNHLSRAAQGFAELWPVFKVQELRRRELANPHYGPRSKMIAEYLSAGAQEFEPKCWRRHSSESMGIPVDWPHVLAALYRVRCNLFHGEKAVSSEGDQKMVGRSHRVLVHFLKDVCLT